MEYERVDSLSETVHEGRKGEFLTQQQHRYPGFLINLSQPSFNTSIRLI